MHRKAARPISGDLHPSGCVSDGHVSHGLGQVFRTEDHVFKGTQPVLHVCVLECASGPAPVFFRSIF